MLVYTFIARILHVSATNPNTQNGANRTIVRTVYVDQNNDTVTTRSSNGRDENGVVSDICSVGLLSILNLII